MKRLSVITLLALTSSLPAYSAQEGQEKTERTTELIKWGGCALVATAIVVAVRMLVKNHKPKSEQKHVGPCGQQVQPDPKGKGNTSSPMSNYDQIHVWHSVHGQLVQAKTQEDIEKALKDFEPYQDKPELEWARKEVKALRVASVRMIEVLEAINAINNIHALEAFETLNASHIDKIIMMDSELRKSIPCYFGCDKYSPKIWYAASEMYLKPMVDRAWKAWLNKQCEIKGPDALKPVLLQPTIVDKISLPTASTPKTPHYCTYHMGTVPL
jgi:hypothetical protein